MANVIVIRDYYTYKEVQKIKVKFNGSITFRPEIYRGRNTMVIRNYHTNEVVQRATIKTSGSYEYFAR